MRRIFRIIKSIFFWSYARNTWQWDVLCVLILVFIFLTPKSCFEKSELQRGITHQNQFAATLLISAETPVNEADKGEIERRVRAITGRTDAVVTGVRRRLDAEGKMVALEVDIR